jgi:phytoene dehydrogenase-like protein
MEKSIIIIGAGIAGLSAGCYGQMNGYRTQIFELHDKPGGLCTSWKRKEYTIDGCLHWLVGSSPGNSFYRIWKELGAVQGRRMIDHDVFITIEGNESKVFTVYTDVDRLESHMKELAPQDKKIIEKFTNAVRACAGIDLPVDKAPELYGPLDGPEILSKMLPFLKIMQSWKGISIQDFAQEFTDPFLRQVFALTFNLPDFPMMAVLMTLAWMHQKSAGFPEGGSLEFSRAIERRYLNLGGEIHYRAPVSKILVQNGKSVGVRLADGTEHGGDIVISAADGHSTIFQMLDGKYISKKVQEYYEQFPLFPPLIQVTLGVARSFQGEPRLLLYHLKQPTIIAGKEEKLLGVEIYNFDATLAPPGKTVLDVKFFSDYEYWKSLKQNPKHYKAEKEKIAKQVINLLDQRFPGLAGQVEMCDVATPMTWERYTGNWRASFEGWLITTKTFGMSMSKTLPGLKNFYMCGQWVEPGGGVPSAALSARNLVQVICKRDRKSFVSNMPSAQP